MARPAAYELAIADPWCFRLEHFPMFAAGVLFWRRWWPLVLPSSMAEARDGPMLVTADLVNTVVAATLAFGPLPLYRWYEELSSRSGSMPGSTSGWRRDRVDPEGIVYLVPAMVIAARHFGIAASMRSPRPGRRFGPRWRAGSRGRGSPAGTVIGSLLKAAASGSASACLSC